ncbi:unnamed protein product [Peronospora farinosa]|uniref:BED-type domain-containing protein n=1 Tax=Peronospora farinosa TaxID=134698 RepID=A0AAV0TID7_9STRA|nr:unnamed protein product [Peronospora farinosa]CAI5720846.1 unnamed protein product [Peronospora farinosa]
MGRPQLPIWNEFVTTVPADADKRSPDVACLHCRALVCNARPASLLSHASRCSEMPDHIRLRVGRSDRPPKTMVSPLGLQNTKTGQINTQSENQNQIEGEEEVEMEMEMETTSTTPPPPMPTERRPVLGKRARIVTSTTGPTSDTLEQVLTSIRDVMDKSLEVKREELQLRKEELEFQKEALSAKLDDRRQAREEERRDRREQREADRQERLELARIENEKNLAFLKAVMESSAQRR